MNLRDVKRRDLSRARNPANRLVLAKPRGDVRRARMGISYDFCVCRRRARYIPIWKLRVEDPNYPREGPDVRRGYVPRWFYDPEPKSRRVTQAID